MRSPNPQKGSTLYFALVILAISGLVVLSISSLLVLQIKAIKTLGDSTLAFFGANTGLEEVLYYAYGDKGINVGDTYLGNLDSIQYQVIVNASSTCGAMYYCIESIGTYLPSQTKRALRAGI